MAAKILFRATENLGKGPELWVTDGTSGGTQAVKDSGGNYVYAPLYLTYLGNGEMVFSAYDATHGQELWVTDGTSAGTHLLADINPGSGSSSPGGDAHSITYLGSGTHMAVFTAEDGSGYGNYDLWVTDGTAVGTHLLKDTTHNLVPYNTHGIAALGNGKALFDASDGSGNYGDELWVTNGTNAGTYRLADIYAGFAGSYPQSITAIGSGEALFSATDGNASGDHGYELWITDGTALGTHLVADINTTLNGNGGTAGSYPHEFTPLGNGEVVFSADRGPGFQLFVTDGTRLGTLPVLGINSVAVTVPTELTALGNGTGKAVFASDDGVHGTELWVTDGHSGAGHTYMIDDIIPGAAPSSPHDLTALGNGKVLFGAAYNSYTELFITDGTSAGTVRLTGATITSPADITPVGNGYALFQATYSLDLTHQYGTELFITNGTAGGTHLVKNIYPDTSSVTGSDPSGFAVFTPVCFCRGTLIRTDRGEIAVEALAVGDRVETLSGAFKPIRWIGFGRDLVTRRHSLARPVIVRRGALADDVPRRDLRLTHGHALYVGGVLVPVEHLINHRSILWDDSAQVAEYYHLELADHDVVFAEGAPAESYYDASNRAHFQNVRPGSRAAAAERRFAPLLTGGDAVARIWAGLLVRAGGQIEDAACDDPDLHLVVGGKRLDPASEVDDVATFMLDRPPAVGLRLRSRSAVPSLTGLGRGDHRRLGVAIRQLVLDGAGAMTSIGHDAPLLAAGGCHAAEAGCCWTDGALDLPAALFAHLRGAFRLIVHTQRQGMRYPIAAAAEEAAVAAAA